MPAGTASLPAAQFRDGVGDFMGCYARLKGPTLRAAVDSCQPPNLSAGAG